MLLKKTLNPKIHTILFTYHVCTTLPKLASFQVHLLTQTVDSYAEDHFFVNFQCYINNTVKYVKKLALDTPYAIFF